MNIAMCRKCGVRKVDSERHEECCDCRELPREIEHFWAQIGRLEAQGVSFTDRSNLHAEAQLKAKIIEAYREEDSLQGCKLAVEEMLEQKV